MNAGSRPGAELKKNLSLFTMLIPGLLFLALFNYLPLFGVVIAFKKINYSLGILKSPWVWFDNFTFLVKSPSFPLMIRNTLGYNIGFLLIGNAAALTVAICLHELRSKKAAKFYQSFLLLPYFISWIAVSYIVFAFLSTDKGFINTSILAPFGLEPVTWYQNKEYWPYILTFMNRWRYTGFDCVIYLAALAGLDQTLFEAARVDGASKIQQIRKVTLPLMFPIISVVVLMAVGRIFIGDFDLFYAVPRNSGQLFDATQVIDTYVYRALTQMGNIGMSAAACMFQSVLGFVLILAVNRITKRLDRDSGLF